MEIIQGNNNNKPYHNRSNGYVAAILLIIIGLLFLGRNLGIVDRSVLRIFVSWQMLLVVLGFWSIFRKQYFGGIILLAIGCFFMIPKLINVNGNWMHTYWPLIFVLLGILLLLKHNKIFNGHSRQNCVKDTGEAGTFYHLEDGYLNSENTFGSVKHIVLDPVFKGANVKTTFAGTIIDLRRTFLDDSEIIIDVNCVFGGIEVYAPTNWCIVSEIKTLFGGYNDKRHQSGETIDYEHKLIFKGNLTFSGIEIKS